MYKLYNPDDKEFLSFVGGVEVRITSRQAIFLELNDLTVNQLKEGAPALEVVIAPLEEVPKAKKPAKLGKGGKKK